MKQNMNDLLFRDGELARRVNPHNFRWPELIFLAEAEREPFADVRIITLYSYCEDQVLEVILNELPCTNSTINIDLDKPQFRSKIKTLLPSIQAREFIEIFPNEVVVAVDSETVDDQAVDRALEMLETIEEFTVGSYFEFGSSQNYSYKRVEDTCEKYY